MEQSTKKKRLDAALLRHYHFARHGILDGHKASSVVDATERAVGIHAARPRSPFAALHARCDNFAHGQLNDALFESKDVIKVRCMRRTLHIVSLQLAPLVHAATRSQRLTPCHTALRQLGLTGKQVDVIRSHVLEVASRQPIDVSVARGIAAAIKNPKVSPRSTVLAVRWTIKLLWEEGVLCYGNRAVDWGRENRVYHLTKDFYPSLDLNAIEEPVAEQELVYRHISQYGPVTVNDICWWSGLSRGRVQRAIHALKASVCNVRVDSWPDDLYMSIEDVGKLQTYKAPDDDWVALLAYEDSALKGYFETRYRYVDSASYDRLFNTIGEVRASIIVSGMAVGTWHYCRTKQRIDWQLLVPVKPKQKRLIEEKVRQMERNHHSSASPGR